MKNSKVVDLEETIKELCSGCDVPSNHLQYYKNGKQYCPRCYEEVKAMYEYKRKKK